MSDAISYGRLADEVQAPAARGEGAGRVRTVATVETAGKGDDGTLLLTAAESFDAVADAWRSFERQALTTPFQSFEWLRLWHHCIGAAQGVEPLVVFGHDRAGGLRLLLPFGLEPGPLARRLVWLGSPVCDYQAPLVDAGIAAALDADTARRIVMAVMAWSGADYALLGRQPERLAEAIANPFAALSRDSYGYAAHATSLGTDWESFYAARRSAKTRRRQREKERRLARLGKVRFAMAETAPERAALAQKIVDLKLHQLDPRGGSNVFASKAVARFFAAAAGAPALAETVHLAALTVDGAFVAGSFSLVGRHSFYYVIPVFEGGRYGRCSPGNILLHRLMAWAMEHGLTRFDFTIGDEAYKAEWADQSQPVRFAAIARTLRGRLCAAAVRAVNLAIARVKRMPPAYEAARRAVAAARRLRRAGP